MSRPLLIALLLLQTGSAVTPVVNQSFFRYRRGVLVANDHAASNLPACATLDGVVYAHAAPSLKDLRLYKDRQEIPYAITLSESADADSEPARVVNRGMQGTHIVFDLEMPSRPYTDVTLDLDAHDFIATAAVDAVENADPPALTRIGTFTLFDLTSQHLSRSTTLHLQESTFHELRIDLALAPAPGAASLQPSPAMVLGATVPPSREAQVIYTTVAQSTAFTQRGQQTVAKIHLPAHVPVEHVSFALAPGANRNFSRDVEITDHTQGTPASARETITGTIQRVFLNQGGAHEIHEEQLGVPATLGANLQHDADVEIAIDNGNDAPLPLAAVRLEMRERHLCFSAPAGPLALYYGDSALDAPVYDFARVVSLTGKIRPATLAPEEQNPEFHPRPAPPKPLTERYPQLLWIALLAVVCLLGMLALNSAKRMPR